MTNAAVIRERFLRDDPPRRLGNLAANLARIDSFGADPNHADLVRGLAEESAFFIEWAAPAAEPEVQFRLLALQRLLVKWIRAWDTHWNDPQQRQSMRETSRQWARALLQIAGFLPRR